MMKTAAITLVIKLIETEKFHVFDKCPNTDKNYSINIDINSDYTLSIIFNDINTRSNCNIITDKDLLDQISSTNHHHGNDVDTNNNHNIYPIQIKDFENINWDIVMNGRCGASSYLVRKGLSRKAQLSLQLKRYCSKNIESILNKSIPYTLIIETWNAYEEMKLDFGRGTFASFEDMNIIQTTSIRQRLDWCLHDIKSIVEDPDHLHWYWILKPSVTNKGYDIAIIKDWNDVLNTLEHANHVREWVLQRYLEQPLLLNKHKFHLRVYILCVGGLRVFVFNQILMLIAAHSYDINDIDDIYGHLTNTARSVEDINFDETKFIRLLEDLPLYLLKQHNQHIKHTNISNSTTTNSSNNTTNNNNSSYSSRSMNMLDAIKVVDDIKTSIHSITKQLFTAFENEYSIFCPMSNCYEVFGLDFMVDDDFKVYLLEVNPGPDFQQTGTRLNKVISDLWQQIHNIVIDSNLIHPTINSMKTHTEIDDQYTDIWSKTAKDFNLVYSKECSTAKLTSGMSFIN